MRYLVILLCLAASGALAQQDVCPPAPEHDAERSDLMRDLAVSRDATEAGIIAGFLWQLWTDAPDAQAQEWLDEGMERRRVYDLSGSRAILDALVAYCPDYAEGWNQRAFSAYLAQDYAAALADLDRALALMPDHVAALSGKALTLIGLGRDTEAQEVLRAALRLNPWLAERALLREPPGQDI